MHDGMQAQLALLTEQSTDVVLRLDRDGRCRYASPSARDVLAYAPDVLVGRHMLTLFHPADRRQAFDRYRAVIRGDAERCVVTARIRRPDAADGWLWIEARIGRVGDSDDRGPVELIASARNVTERRELEIELERVRERAEAAVKAKSSFLANMSHELRTPMNGVIGFTELLLKGELGPEQRHQAQVIAESGRAMMRLLNDILDLSRMDAGQMNICNEPFDLAHALRNCVQLVTPAVSRQGLELGCEFCPDLPTLVDGDGLRVRQIVLNLLGNAAKFTLEGSVTLRVRPLAGSDGHILIEVEDTGIGIEQDRQAAIFLPFVQAESRTASRFGGSGLGLAISHQLALLMGGRLELESKPGRGSRFSLILPFRAVPDRRAEPRVVLPGAGDTSALRTLTRVLVAEDHDVNQLLVCAMLKELGCTADVAKNGVEAVAMVEAAANAETPYGVVLMDMRMPEMDGLEATRCIRAAGFGAHDLPIIALTANAYADDVTACLEAGMQEHLAKPIKLAELRSALMRRTTLRLALDVPVRSYRPSRATRDRYLARRAETAQRLEQLMQLGSVEDPALSEIVDMLHKLAGTAQMFGEGKLGEEVRQLEASIECAPASERCDHLSRALEAIRLAA